MKTGKCTRIVIDAYHLCNDRSRLQFALDRVFTKLGVPDQQRDKIIKDVRNCDFSSLDKLLKTN